METTTFWLMLAIFPTCSFAGLAALLRSETPITRRAVISATLNSGLFGVVVCAAMLHAYGDESLYLIVSVSLLSGLGGNTMIDLAIEGVKSYVRKHDETN